MTGSAPAAHTPARHVTSLLVTPSIGCSDAEHFELRDHRFFRP